jgi:transcriptional regulator with XRE-family HTH domain
MLQKLREQGLSQHEIAQRACVPSQYLSDVKTGRRVMTELFARRLAEEFGVDYLWLLEGRGNMTRPTVQGPAHARRGVLVPVLSEPFIGDPRSATTIWGGNLIELSGPAAALAEQCRHPYVLRLGQDAHDGSFKVGDQLLVSQTPEQDASVALLRVSDVLRLARRSGARQWRDLLTGRKMPKPVDLAGRCVALIWRLL